MHHKGAAPDGSAKKGEDSSEGGHGRNYIRDERERSYSMDINDDCDETVNITEGIVKDTWEHYGDPKGGNSSMDMCSIGIANNRHVSSKGEDSFAETVQGEGEFVMEKLDGSNNDRQLIGTAEYWRDYGAGFIAMLHQGGYMDVINDDDDLVENYGRNENWIVEEMEQQDVDYDLGTSEHQEESSMKTLREDEQYTTAEQSLVNDADNTENQDKYKDDVEESELHKIDEEGHNDGDHVNSDELLFEGIKEEEDSIDGDTESKNQDKYEDDVEESELHNINEDEDQDVDSQDSSDELLFENYQENLRVEDLVFNEGGLMEETRLNREEDVQREDYDSVDEVMDLPYEDVDWSKVRSVTRDRQGKDILQTVLQFKPQYQKQYRETELDALANHGYDRDDTQTQYQEQYGETELDALVNHGYDRDDTQTQYQEQYEETELDALVNHGYDRDDTQTQYQEQYGETDLDAQVNHGYDRGDTQTQYQEQYGETDLDAQVNHGYDRDDTQIQYQEQYGETELDALVNHGYDRGDTQTQYQDQVQYEETELDARVNHGYDRGDTETQYQEEYKETELDTQIDQDHDIGDTEMQYQEEYRETELRGEVDQDYDRGEMIYKGTIEWKEGNPEDVGDDPFQKLTENHLVEEAANRDEYDGGVETMDLTDWSQVRSVREKRQNKDTVHTMLHFKPDGNGIEHISVYEQTSQPDGDIKAGAKKTNEKRNAIDNLEYGQDNKEGIVVDGNQAVKGFFGS